MKKYLQKIKHSILLGAMLFGINQVNYAQTFNFTGSNVLYTVPSLVTVINVTVAGARGGGNYGSGAVFTSTMPVTPGQVLVLNVGGAGNTGAGPSGGFNGGGNGGYNYGNEGSGGGASDIRVAPYTLFDRVVCAGGGGGGGGYAGGQGGHGGFPGLTGGAGQGSAGTGGGLGGGGGAGGSNGGCPSGTTGSWGQGGHGASCAYGGGGGGGGWYGGGGGGGDNNSCCLDGAGGGGGGSYCLYAGAICTTGGNGSAGYIIICDNLPAPTPTNITSAGNQTVCAGKSASLSASGSGVISWFSTPSGGSSLGTGTTFVTSTLSAGTYTFYSENYTCMASNARAAVTLTVIANPTITATSGAICIGQSFTIVPSGANTYTFQGGGAVKTPTTTTSYTVVGTGTNGCVSPVFATSNVTVNSLPTVAVNSGTICSGNTFTISPSGANTYTVQGGNLVVSPLSLTSYTVRGTSLAGCLSANTATSNVTVNTTPTVAVNSGSICTGNSFTIVPSGANSYTISGGLNIVSPLNNTLYNVIGTSAQGCVSSNTAVSNVSVNITPTVSVNSGTICTGNSFTIVPSGASTYTISGGASVVSPLTNTLYNINGTSAQGCVSSNTAVSNVAVNISPTVAVNSGTICSGNTFTLVPSGANTYTISGGASVVSPLTNTLYNITGTSAQGCVSSNTAVSNVVVNSTPTITVNSGSICTGNSFTITPSGASTYTISGGVSVVSPMTNTLYNITGTSAQGCVSSNTAISNVTVNITPTIAVNSGTICSGNSFTLVPSGANTYTFNSGNAVVSPSTTSSYSVTGTSAEGCVSSNTVVSNVTVNALPNVNSTASNATICIGETSTLSASGASTYVWNTTSTLVTLVVSPTITTSYTVSGTDNNGCVNTSAITQNVSACTGIDKVAEALEATISIYPNPNNGEFTILSSSDSRLSIINELGQIVKTVSLNANNEHKVLINEMANGIYFVVGQSNNQVIKQKMIVNK